MILTEDELRRLMEDHKGCPICGEDDNGHEEDCLCDSCYEAWSLARGRKDDA
jgi:hypothetical protein